MDAQTIYHLGPRDINQVYNLSPEIESEFVEREESSEEKTKRKGKEVLSDEKHFFSRKTRFRNEDGSEYTIKRWGIYYQLPRFRFSIQWRSHS